MNSQVLARRELARRTLARRDLIAFSWYTFRGYQPSRCHRLLARYLQQVERFIATGGQEGIGRLMVFMPPRHGKSELVSVRFPAWFLGRNPDRRVILTSCTADLATGFSRQVRNIIRDNAYQCVFGQRSGLPRERQIIISDDSRAANAWDLAGHRGGLVAAGVGGSIVGRGAHLAIIDDPIKNRLEAESASVRDAIDEWYRSTLYTRLEEGAAVVLMHQRWHADDLAGRLLRRMIEERGADLWTVLSLPAIAEEWAGWVEIDETVRAARAGWWKAADPLNRQPGEALWPERFPVATLERIRANVGGYEWDALYQQRPQRVEGALIRAYEITIIGSNEVPSGMRETRYWDLAVSGRRGADYICGARVGRDANGRLYILDIARFPGPWVDARPKMIRTMLADPARVVQGIEVAGQQGGYYQELVRDPTLQGRSIEPINPRSMGNKVVRANIWASRISDGLVHMVRAPWNDDFIREAIAFPRGAHDDQVDAVSGAVHMLAGHAVRAYVIPY